MGKTPRQRALLAAYREREMVGGVCAICSRVTQRVLLLPASDPRSQRNRFRFSVSSGTCIHAALAADWAAHGPGSFCFEVLEELPKDPDRTDEQFRADLSALAALWRERLSGEGVPLY